MIEEIEKHWKPLKTIENLLRNIEADGLYPDLAISHSDCITNQSGD